MRRECGPVQDLSTCASSLLTPVLLHAGEQDDLVTYTNSCKMAASLQHAQRGIEGNSAVHLRIIQNLGHGGAISQLKQVNISLKRWLWLKTTLGLVVYD